MTCAVCGKQAVLFYSLTHQIYRCPACGLYSASIPLTYSPPSNVDSSTRDISVSLQDLRKKNYSQILSLMHSLLPSEARGLEVGSSYGWFIEMASEEGFRCYGLEPVVGMVEQSRSRGHEVICGYYPSDVPSTIQAVDFVIFNDVLEHIPDLASALATTRDILKPNGIVIINIPMSTGILFKTAGFLRGMGFTFAMDRLWQFGFHSPHYFYFNKENLSRAVKRFGFEPVAYHRVETLDRLAIRERISIDPRMARFSGLLSAPIKLMFPILSLLGEDVGCLYARKEA